MKIKRDYGLFAIYLLLFLIFLVANTLITESGLWTEGVSMGLVINDHARFIKITGFAIIFVVVVLVYLAFQLKKIKNRINEIEKDMNITKDKNK